MPSRRRRKKRQPGEGCVYVIELGPFKKIGYTAGSVKARRNDLQVGAPIPLRIVAKYYHAQPRHLEAFLHSMLHEDRLLGEWFLCSLGKINATYREAERLEGSWAQWQAAAKAEGAPRLIENWQERIDGAPPRMSVKDRQRVMKAFADWFDNPLGDRKKSRSKP